MTVQSITGKEYIEDFYTIPDYPAGDIEDWNEFTRIGYTSFWNDITKDMYSEMQGIEKDLKWFADNGITYDDPGNKTLLDNTVVRWCNAQRAYDYSRSQSTAVYNAMLIAMA